MKQDKTQTTNQRDTSGKYLQCYSCLTEITLLETSLAVQQLRFCLPDAAGVGLIPGQGTKIHIAAEN